MRIAKIKISSNNTEYFETFPITEGQVSPPYAFSEFKGSISSASVITISAGTIFYLYNETTDRTISFKLLKDIEFSYAGFTNFPYLSAWMENELVAFGFSDSNETSLCRFARIETDVNGFVLNSQVNDVNRLYEEVSGIDTSQFVKVSDYDDIDVLNKIKNVDGSGSGLDADLLDSHHASDFALASDLSNYTPLSYHDKIGCSVYMSADQTIPHDTETIVAFDSVNFDYGSGWDNVNYKWTAPKAGLIIAIAKISTRADWTAYGTAYLRIRKNGTVTVHTRIQKYAGLATAVLEVNLGDTIDFSVAQNSGASRAINSTSSRTYANIYMLWHE